ncbi:MAG: allantoinase AllB [Sporichthyaceae bacterium]|nr:allantoinase AllB [Sporichthyaceae bacterium]
MTELDLVISAPRVVTAAGTVARRIGVADGRISAIVPFQTDLPAARTVELDDDVVLLPGLVDTHVHVNEPGRTEWEGFATATRAAAAGGVTTIVDMPLNSIPPTVDVAALEVKRKVAESQCAIDVGFWGGAVPGNRPALRGLHDAGVFGFKCFLLHSGVDEFPHLQPAELEQALRELVSFDALMIVHAEDSTAIDHAPSCHGERYRDFLASRPRGAENTAIAQVIELARWTGARVHILHLSSSDALPMIASARRDGVRITVETCPHYLTLCAEEIPDGATQYKCCPPIREADNRELLWRGLAEGVIDCVVSDHSPCVPELKRFDIGDFGVAWGGISSLQLGLSAVWTEARRRGFELVDVVRWMAQRPAELAGLARKGRIALGYDADFAVFAPDAAYVVDAGTLHHRNPVTPYAGRALAGVVRATWLRGELVDAAAAAPRGRLLRRGEA